MSQVTENSTVINTPESVQENNTQPAESVEQINWRKFREERAKERKEKEIIEADRTKKAAEIEALKAAVEALASKPSPQQYEPEEESEDDKIQKLVNKALAEKEKQYEEHRRIKEHQEFPQRLTSTYSDFDKVCSSDNLDYLEYHYPEVAAPFKHLPDSYEKWSSIYKAVKRFVPNPDSGKDQKKAEKNFMKPQSMSASGATSTGDDVPRSLDDKRKADNWQRMQKRMKGIA